MYNFFLDAFLDAFLESFLDVRLVLPAIILIHRFFFSINYIYLIMRITSITSLHSFNNYLNLLSQLSLMDNTIDNNNKLKEYIDNLPEHINIYVMVNDNGKIVGTITLLIEDKIIHNFGKVAHIEDLVVDKEYRRKSIGSQLIEFSINKAMELKCYKICLSCSQENKCFYIKNGFNQHELLMAKYF